MNLYESIESDMLTKYIEGLEKWLAKITDKSQALRLQHDIMFLKKDILPIVLKNTVCYFDDFSNNAVKKLNEAVKYGCNGLLLYYPIKDDFKNFYSVGCCNYRNINFRHNREGMYIQLQNFDIFGETVPIVISNLNDKP